MADNIVKQTCKELGITQKTFITTITSTIFILSGIYVLFTEESKGGQNIVLGFSLLILSIATVLNIIKELKDAKR